MKRALRASDARWRELWDQHDRWMAEFDRKMTRLDRQEARCRRDWIKRSAVQDKKLELMARMIEACGKVFDRTGRETTFQLQCLLHRQNRRPAT